MHINPEVQLDFDDVLLMPRAGSINSRSEIKSLQREFTYETATGWKTFSCCPIMASNMATIGTVRMAKALLKHDYMCALEKHCPRSEITELFQSFRQTAKSPDEIPQASSHVFPTVGLTESLTTFQDLARQNLLRGIVIDVANGYIPKMLERVKEVRACLPEAFIIAGNVVSQSGVFNLFEAGANCVKLGIGSGSVCLTRRVAGVGRPTISMLDECASLAHSYRCYVMCDGGLNSSGDIVKAFGAGADFIMSGKLFASCYEAGQAGECIVKNGKEFKEYYGMASKHAQLKYSSKPINGYRTSEGRVTELPVTGSVKDVIKDLNGGIRSGMAYLGVSKVSDIAKDAEFYRVNHQLNSTLSQYEVQQ